MADDQDQSSKTEAPSERKISKAREEGNVPQSKEIKSAVIMVAGVAFVMWIAPFLMQKISIIGAYYLAHVHDIRVETSQDLRLLLMNAIIEVGKYVAIPFGIFMICALAADLMQNGFMFSPNKIALDFNKINPLSGLKRMIGVQKLVDTLKDILKISIVSIVSYMVVAPKIMTIPTLASVSIMGSLSLLKEVSAFLVFAVALLMLIIAAADWWWSVYSHRKKLRMTKQEVKDEYKQMEGDPAIKAKLHAIRMEKFRQRMMQSVPTANVVITNPTHYAIALKYDMNDMSAPLVVAKGVDFLAKKIREIANENDITIVENPPLARALYASVDVDEEIPAEHFKAVAEVIGYVMRLKGQVPV
ncbi:MAG: flagellar biosynthesis protein FlhB [Alphaproteobacteria bacterium]|nr:flagellar biosynthesis protein FlhB [Alphaproteobacteria bacterium]